MTYDPRNKFPDPPAAAPRAAGMGERTALYAAFNDANNQQLIRQAHQEWLSALDAIQDPIFIHDKDCRITRSNRAYADMAGLTVKEVVGHPYYEMFPKQSGPLPACEAMTQQGGISEEEVQLPDGRVFLSRATSVKAADGGHLYSLHIMYDISARKQMEQALRDGEERLLLALAAAHQAWFDLNVQTGAATISAEYASMLGHDPATFDASLQHWIDDLHPDEREAVLQVFQRTLQSGEADGIEYRRRTRSGDWKWFRSIGKVIGWDEQRRPLRMIGIHTDITPHKQAELALIESEARFRTMFDSLAEGVLLFGANQRIQTCNPAAERILGLARDQLIGAGMLAAGWQPCHENLTACSVDKLPVMRALQSGESQRGVIIGLRRPGSELQWLSVNAEPIRDAHSNDIVAAIVSFEDITRRKQDEQAVHRLNRTLKALSAGNHELIHATDETELLQSMCRVIADKGGYRMVWVGYPQQDADRTIKPMAQAGVDQGYLETARINWGDGERGDGPTGRAIRTGEIQIAQDIQRDPAMQPWRDEAQRHGFAASISLPLLNQKQVMGVLVIYSSEADAFNQDEIALLREMSEDLAFGIVTLRMRDEQQRSTEQLRKSLEDAVQSIAAMVEMRDPYTAGHQRRVAELAAAIAGEMGLSAERVHAIHLAGTIHDLGKIQVPAEILSKPRRLNSTEYSLIKEHSQGGYDILKHIDFPWPLAQMVLQHHERLDGSGYPLGLKGDQILLEASIIAVADVVEAMSSHRPYRAGLGLDAAIEEISKGRGVHYPAEVVDACVRLLREKGFAFK